MLKKKIWTKFKRITELFTKKWSLKLSKIWVWDPGSENKPIPDPGSRDQKGTGSRIRNTGSISGGWYERIYALSSFSIRITSWPGPNRLSRPAAGRWSPSPRQPGRPPWPSQQAAGRSQSQHPASRRPSPGIPPPTQECQSKDQKTKKWEIDTFCLTRFKGAQVWDIRSLGFSWFLHHKVSTGGRLWG